MPDRLNRAVREQKYLNNVLFFQYFSSFVLFYFPRHCFFLLLLLLRRRRLLLLLLLLMWLMPILYNRERNERARARNAFDS